MEHWRRYGQYSAVIWRESREAFAVASEVEREHRGTVAATGESAQGKLQNVVYRHYLWMYLHVFCSLPLSTLQPHNEMQIFPSPYYMMLCAAAHERAGMLDHFVDSTLLHDGTTTLRKYISSDAALESSYRRFIEGSFSS